MIFQNSSLGCRAYQCRLQASLGIFSFFFSLRSGTLRKKFRCKNHSPKKQLISHSHHYIGGHIIKCINNKVGGLSGSWAVDIQKYWCQQDQDVKWKAGISFIWCYVHETTILDPIYQQLKQLPAKIWYSDLVIHAWKTILFIGEVHLHHCL